LLATAFWRTSNGRRATTAASAEMKNILMAQINFPEGAPGADTMNLLLLLQYFTA
jgi:hypothetical protein